MTAYFTDTVPVAHMPLDSHRLGVGSDEILEMNKDESLPSTHPLSWDATDIDWEAGNMYCMDKKPVYVLLKGKSSMDDFKEKFLGSEKTFENPPNRLTGDPIVLKPGDTCLIMSRCAELNNELQWKLIENLKTS